jgi:hypothetical protein
MRKKPATNKSECDGLDVRPIVERMMARLLEDIESGRTKVTTADIQRMMALAGEVDRVTPKEIEVRWIEERKGSGDGE